MVAVKGFEEMESFGSVVGEALEGPVDEVWGPLDGRVLKGLG